MNNGNINESKTFSKEKKTNKAFTENTKKKKILFQNFSSFSTQFFFFFIS